MSSGILGGVSKDLLSRKGQKPLPPQLFRLCAALTKGLELESLQYRASGRVCTWTVMDKSSWETGIGGRIGSCSRVHLQVSFKPILHSIMLNIHICFIIKIGILKEVPLLP